MGMTAQMLANSRMPEPPSRRASGVKRTFAILCCATAATSSTRVPTPHAHKAPIPIQLATAEDSNDLRRVFQSGHCCWTQLSETLRASDYYAYWPTSWSEEENRLRVGCTTSGTRNA